MGNTASSSDSCSELDLRYKSTLVNHTYGSMYIENSESTKTAKYHSNLNLLNQKKSKITKFLKFISPQNNSFKIEKRDPNKVKNRRSKNFITKSLVFFRTPSQKDKSPNNSLKCSTPLDFDIGPKSTSMYLDHENLSAKFKTHLSLKSDKSSNKLNNSTDSKNDSGILIDYKRNENNKKVHSSMSTFSINDLRQKSNQISSSSASSIVVGAGDGAGVSSGSRNCDRDNKNVVVFSNNRRLSINSTNDSTFNQKKNSNNIRRTTTFHTTTIKQNSIEETMKKKILSKNNSKNVKQNTKNLTIPSETEQKKSSPLLSQTLVQTLSTKLSSPIQPRQPPQSLLLPSSLKENKKTNKIIVQASTSELLRCLTSYLIKKYPYLIKSDNEPLTNSNRFKADSREVISWLRSADRALLIQGWQEIAFMNPVNVVFVYLLIRDSLNQPKTVYELQCHVMSCLYLAFSYMGNEISYPLKPFLVEDERDLFWQRIVALMNLLSTSMLRINQDARFFTELFYELKSYASPIIMDQSSLTIQRSITVNSFKSYDKNFQTNKSRIASSNKPLVGSNSSKTMLKSPNHFTNTHRESCLYPSNDTPLFKPIAYCI